MAKAKSYASPGTVARVLAPLRNKLWFRRIIAFGVKGLVAGGSGGIAVLLFSRVWPVWYPWRWALIVTWMGLVAGVSYGIIKRPSVADAARFADDHGLKERMVTALAFERDDSAMARLQRDEAVGKFRRHEQAIVKQIHLWAFPRWAVVSLIGFVVVGGALWWLPHPMETVVLKQQQVDQALAKERKKVEKAEKQLAENDTLPDQVKAVLRKQVQDLKKQLEEATSAEEGMKALADAEARLDELARQTAASEQMLKTLSHQLTSHTATAAPSRAVSEGDRETLREALKEMEKTLRTLKPDEREALAARLNNGAEGLKESDVPQAEHMAELLRQAAQHVQAGDSVQAAGALGGAFNQMFSASQSLVATQRAVAGMTQSLGESKQALAQASQWGETSGQLSQRTGNSEEKTPAAESTGTTGTGGQAGGSNGSAGGNSTGTSGGTGSGIGAGAGSGGSGAGKGSGSRELVSVPSARLSGGGPKDTVGGPLGEGSEMEVTKGALGSPGVTRPYTDVFDQYEAAARQALEKSDLPPQFQQLIRAYFSDIQPE